MDSGYKHFIRAIRSGMEIKVCNIDSHRRPALAFKTLTEVCESEDAKRLKQPCIIASLNMDKDSVLDSDQMKIGVSCFSMVDRKLREIKPRADNFSPCPTNNLGIALDDDTTLEQLRRRSKAKRRKLSYTDVHSVQADENEKKPQDESDLDQPLIRLKFKLSKTTKVKRECLNSVGVSSTTAIAVKSEQYLVSEDSFLVRHESAPAIHIKAEVTEAEELGSQSTSFADHLSIDHNKRSSYHGVAPKRNLEVVQCENKERLLLEEECQSCITNEMSFDHLEDIEPTCMVVPLDGVSAKGENLYLSCPEFLVLPPSTSERGKEVGKALSSRNSPSQYQNSDLLCQSSMEEVSDQSNSSGIQVSDMAADDNVGCMGLNHEISSNLTKDKDEPDFPKKHYDYLTRQELSPENKANGGSHVHSTPEQHQHPERLLSTRKAISPSTQEKLRLAMESIELHNDVKKCSLGKFSRRKVVLSPGKIIQKSKNARGNRTSPHIPWGLPNLSTGYACIKDCSESAIVFSQRQMHDIESLAGKLMSELKSMKDIVEQKLLFEAYSNVSLKNDADEVKSAIENATKVEEAATKWLNMMSRDCNRFCKIMKLAPENIDTFKYASPREGKKIKFADEAGGELCHVKFFEGAPMHTVSDSVEQ